MSWYEPVVIKNMILSIDLNLLFLVAWAYRHTIRLALIPWAFRSKFHSYLDYWHIGLPNILMLQSGLAADGLLPSCQAKWFTYVWSTSCLVSGSFVMYAVRPTALEPFPDVYWPLGTRLCTYCKSCDLLVPGSPHNKMFNSDLQNHQH